LNAPIKVDPIALATDVGRPLTSTEHLRKVLDDFRAQDRQALRNGGPGYGDWRDEADREEMARRAEFEAKQSELSGDG
jgi:hypothetical protein